mmetsp:Transcript_61989/g.115903  ORF Transcript_61989/g.115903 Transcript_61989/m.115903 type:complete len:119 (+) Transcript_61989:375-731(+)
MADAICSHFKDGRTHIVSHAFFKFSSMYCDIQTQSFCMLEAGLVCPIWEVCFIASKIETNHATGSLAARFCSQLCSFEASLWACSSHRTKNLVHNYIMLGRTSCQAFLQCSDGLFFSD